MIYFVRSLFTFLTLYGLVGAVAAKMYLHRDISLSVVTGFAVGLVLVQYLVGPAVLRRLLNIDWYTELPVRNREFLQELCRTKALPMPRVGVLRGAMPNAFTFGRTQSDASIVVTSGLLEALTPEEVNAVIAHELGHIKHRDFLTMTAASIAPLLLYQLYALGRESEHGQPIAWVAYGAYWLSQFLVLALNRTREYGADQFAGHAVADASLLSSALVKICYGIARVEREAAWAKAHGDDQQKTEGRETALLARKIGVLGISSAEAAYLLREPTPESAAALMRWDLENPWARLYELGSTHPLTARRIEALNAQATGEGQAAQFPLPAAAQVGCWTGFPLQLALWAGPWVCVIVLFAARELKSRGIVDLPHGAAELLAIVLLLTWLARIAFRYQGRFTPASIRELGEDVRVSSMMPRAVRIEGTVVGRGNPGSFLSPDLTIQDETGIVFILDRQTFPLARLFLGMKAERWFGQRVTLEGWYRRGPTPHIELSRMTTSALPPDPEGPGFFKDATKGRTCGPATHVSYSRWIQVALAVLGTELMYLYLRF